MKFRKRSSLAYGRRLTVLISACALLPVALYAQRAGGNGGQARGQGRQMSMSGHVYGKVLDAKTNKAVSFATVGVIRAKDSSVVTGVLSESNGNFSVDNLRPGEFLLRINFIGYEPMYKSFALTPQSMEKDLGNFKLQPSSQMLKEAVVTADKSTFEMAIDKKVFNVDKNLASKGGTATDALRQVPTVNVDIDGNVSLRNGSPTIFVDGKKSPLTLDQIPADEIENIEIITNPSAKYDADGMSGIINITLKKDRKPGVNGMIMAGVGTHDQYNGGVNLNIYKKPLNFTLNYFANSRPRIMDGHTDRTNFNNTYLSQQSHEYGTGLFQVGRVGLDYFIDNRNTLSLSGGVGGGNHDENGTIYSDYFNAGKEMDSSSIRTTREKNNFNFISGDLDYTHNFAKEKEQLTVQGSYRRFKGPGNGSYVTNYLDPDSKPLRDVNTQQFSSGGSNNIYTFQSDYTDPLNEGKAKLDGGVKATIVKSNNYSNVLDKQSDGSYIKDLLASYNYSFKQRDYAAYVNFSNQLGNFGYQAGLRFEQYDYTGTLIDSNYSFNYNKPGLFPSIFLSQKLGGNQELQLNYSRRVDRPNFWQISPRIDYEDPQNLRKGNPELEPEYTNSFEFSYNNIFGASNFLATVYFRNTNNLITSYVTPISNDTLLSTFVNASSSNTYGAELTLRSPVTDWWTITANANLFQTDIKASNIKTGLSNSGFSWFAKVNSEMRLPASFVLQLTGNYEADRVIPQGKEKGSGSLDVGLKKDFLQSKALTVTLSGSDIFNTDRNRRYTESEGYFTQDSYRKRLSRVFKINLSYRFGKQDFSLFKRKPKQQQGNDQDMMMQGGPDE